MILKVNGTQTDSKDVSLDDGKSQTVTFQLQKDTPGDYKIEVNGYSGQFTVMAPVPVVTITPSPTPALITEPSSPPLLCSPRLLR